MDFTKEQQRVIRLAQKLLRLAAGTTSSEEAESAQLKVQQLLAEYDLSMSDVSVEEYTAKTVCDEYSVELLPGKMPVWAGILAGRFQNVYDVECVHSRDRSAPMEQHILNFIGVDPNITIATQAYITVYRHLVLKNLPLKYTKKQQEDYRIGFVIGLCNKLMDQKREQEAARNGSCTDIVLARADIIQAYMNTNYPKLRKTRTPNRTVDETAYGRGYQAGNEYNIAPGVRGGRTQTAVA